MQRDNACGRSTRRQPKIALRRSSSKMFQGPANPKTEVLRRKNIARFCTIGSSLPLEDIIDEMGWTQLIGNIDAIKFDTAIVPDSTSSRKASPAPSNDDRFRSPAMRIASSNSSQLQRQASLAYHNAALFDDEMPAGGYTPERYVIETHKTSISHWL
jgi:hypothetical protein